MLKLLSTDLWIQNMRLRMPFRFGIVTLTECPHLFLRARVQVDGRQTWGMAADVLPNKWFTKDPNSAYRDDIADMLKVIRSACDVGIAGGKHPSLFEWWERTYQAQYAWAGGWGYPPLLAGFGASLVERAVIDAFCRAHEAPFSRVLRENRLGIRLGRLSPELAGAEPADLLPQSPLRQVIVRHTVGLTDPLTDADIPPSDRANDGLPQSLEAAVAAYGLTHFKIKLSGDVAADSTRVSAIAALLDRLVGDRYAFTLDGNENFKAVAPLREFWQALSAEPRLAAFLKKLIFVEQPLHRSVALGDEAAAELLRWSERPPIIIDESDSTLESCRTAIESGYAGASHKNCKGILKGIASACLLEHRRRQNPTRPYILSAEDLTNVGPIALMQDLCVVASLGIPHAERNGHHYFKGLSMFPPAVESAVLDAHGDLYHRFGAHAAVNVHHGIVNIGSVVDRGFGAAAEFNVEQFIPADDWTYESLVGKRS